MTSNASHSVAADDWRVVHSGLVLKQATSPATVWKSRYAVLRVREESRATTNPFRQEREIVAEVLLYTHAGSDEARRTMRVAAVRDFSSEERESFGGCGIVLVGSEATPWYLRTMSEAEALKWREAVGEAIGIVKAKQATFSRTMTAAACAGVATAAASAGYTMLLAATAATGAGAVIAGAGLAVDRLVRHQQSSSSAEMGRHELSFSELGAAEVVRKKPTTKIVPPDSDRYGVARVHVQRVRVIRSGGADDALPPTLKIEGDSFGSTETTALETRLAVVLKCGDQVVSSRPLSRAADLNAVNLDATFRVASARATIRLELRAEHGGLVASRAVSIAEIVDRDAEIDIRRVRRQFRAVGRSLSALLSGKRDNSVRGPPSSSSDDSEDEPLEHAAFHARPRPAATPTTRPSKPRLEWFALTRATNNNAPKKSPADDQQVGEQPWPDDEPSCETGEDALFQGLFVQGSADDAGGAKAGSVGGLVQAEIILERASVFDALRGRRAELDRPPRDAAPDPRAVLDLLKRCIVFANWLNGLWNKCEALIRWDNAYESLATAVLTAACVLLWARDHCFALPPAAFLAALLAIGQARLRGIWVIKRVALVTTGKADDDCPDGVLALYKDDDRGRRKWRIHRPRSVATLDLAITELQLQESTQPRNNSHAPIPLETVLVVKFVPAAARAALATRYVAASHLVASQAPKPMSRRGDDADVRRLCADAFDAIRMPDLSTYDADWPALVSPLRAFKVGAHSFTVAASVDGPPGGRRLTYGPRRSLPGGNATKRQKDICDNLNVLTPTGDEDRRARLAISAPARVGIGSRAQYEAERLLAWTSQLVVGGDDDQHAPAYHNTKIRSDSHAVARYHDRVRSGRQDPRRLSSKPKCANRESSASWTLPVLRELERDAGGNSFTAALQTSWRESRGAIHIEVYIPDKNRANRRHRRNAAKLADLKDTARAVFATACADRASLYYHTTKATEHQLADTSADATDLSSISSPLRVQQQATPMNRTHRFDDVGNSTMNEDDDALGLAPRPDGKLVGIAVLPLSQVGTRARSCWLDVKPPRAPQPKRWLHSRGAAVGHGPENFGQADQHDSVDDYSFSDDESNDETGVEASSFSDEDDEGAAMMTKSSAREERRRHVAPRCRVRVVCSLNDDDASKDDRVSLSRWHALDTLEDALELNDGDQTRMYMAEVLRATNEMTPSESADEPGTPATRRRYKVVASRSPLSLKECATVTSDKVAMTSAPAMAEKSGSRNSFGVFERFRRARQSAVEIQNSLSDMVRVCEQWRAMLEWAHPRSTMIVVVVLCVATYVTAQMRADVVGLMAVAATFGPGLLDRVNRALARRAKLARLWRLADQCDIAAKRAASLPIAACAAASADALRCVASSARVSHGAAERVRAAATAPPASKPAVWRAALNSLLESLPAQPELDAVFAERRRAAEWRRERTAVARTLRATWVGPLWRRSVSWRRHFAAVRDRQLCFWYSARHALNGVSPVLVVLLKNATLVNPLQDSSASDMGNSTPHPAAVDDDAPVLTLHAPVLATPDMPREWRLAAAHYRDASSLRSCIQAQILDSDDDPDDLLFAGEAVPGARADQNCADIEPINVDSIPSPSIVVDNTTSGFTQGREFNNGPTISA